MVQPFERALNQIAQNTSVMAEQMPIITDSVKKIYQVESEERNKEEKKTVEKEREEADTAGGKGENQEILRELGGLASSMAGIRSLLRNNFNKSEGGVLDILGNIVKSFLPGSAKGKQEGGFIYNSPIQAFKNGGNVYTVPGSSTGDNHPMLLPAGSFVLNRNASKYLDSITSTNNITNMPFGFETGGMVPTVVESKEKIFAPGKWDGLIPILNSVIPRFQNGGFVGTPASQLTNTGLKDQQGRDIILAPEAAKAFQQMIKDGMPFNSGDVTSVHRSESDYNRILDNYNRGVPGYGKPAANSTHNHGTGMDVHNATGAWIRNNGAKYGWMPNDYPGSHGGHYEFKGAVSTETTNLQPVPGMSGFNLPNINIQKSSEHIFEPFNNTLKGLIQPDKNIEQPSEQDSNQNNESRQKLNPLASLFGFPTLDLFTLLPKFGEIMNLFSPSSNTSSTTSNTATSNVEGSTTPTLSNTVTSNVEGSTTPTLSNMNEGEMNLLTRLVAAEAGGEDFMGQALVARSILNRMSLIQSGKVSENTFNANDSSLKGIIMGRNQYQPISDGRINTEFSEGVLKKAAEAIEMAKNPADLRGRLETSGISAQDITNLVNSTGFRTGSAFEDPSQNVNVVQYGNHYFNTAGNSVMGYQNGGLVQPAMVESGEKIFSMGYQDGGLVQPAMTESSEKIFSMGYQDGGLVQPAMTESSEKIFSMGYQPAMTESNEKIFSPRSLGNSVMGHQPTMAESGSLGNSVMGHQPAIAESGKKIFSMGYQPAMTESNEKIFSMGYQDGGLVQPAMTESNEKILSPGSLGNSVMGHQPAIAESGKKVFSMGHQPTMEESNEKIFSPRSLGNSVMGHQDGGLVQPAMTKSNEKILSPGSLGNSVMGHQPTMEESNEKIFSPRSLGNSVMGYQPAMVESSEKIFSMGYQNGGLVQPAMVESSEKILSPGSLGNSVMGHQPTMPKSSEKILSPGSLGNSVMGHQPTMAESSEKIFSMGYQDGGLVQPVMVESGEKIFSPGSFGPEVQMLNEAIPRFQAGGPVNISRSMNPIHHLFQQANKAKMDSDQSSRQPIIVPVPQPVPMGGGTVNDNTSGSYTPQLPNEPSNHIVSTLIMQTYALMNRIG